MNASITPDFMHILQLKLSQILVDVGEVTRLRAFKSRRLDLGCLCRSLAQPKAPSRKLIQRDMFEVAHCRKQRLTLTSLIFVLYILFDTRASISSFITPYLQVHC
jgi:hypothetical protein